MNSNIETIKKISEDLSLPFTGIEQDWEIELADPNRLDEFIKHYKTNYLLIEEKIVLMSIILASYDEYLEKNNLDVDNHWEEIKKLLNLNYKTFKEILDYWVLYNGKIEELFRISPLVRTFQEDNTLK